MVYPLSRLISCLEEMVRKIDQEVVRESFGASTSMGPVRDLRRLGGNLIGEEKGGILLLVEARQRQTNPRLIQRRLVV
jgi:hypothetical protein